MTIHMTKNKNSFCFFTETDKTILFPRKLTWNLLENRNSNVSIETSWKASKHYAAHRNNDFFTYIMLLEQNCFLFPVFIIKSKEDWRIKKQWLRIWKSIIEKRRDIEKERGHGWVIYSLSLSLLFSLFPITSRI